MSLEKQSNSDLEHDAVVTPDIEIIPGTVQLVDITGGLDVKKNDSNDNVILLPQPTKDINDPLRWTKLKKHLQFFFVWFWCFILAATSNFYGPLWGVWMEDLGFNLNQLTISKAIIFLFLGTGILVIQPTALKLGKRFTYLTCAVVGIVGLAIGSQATSIGSIFVAQAFAGVSAAPVDTLSEISATDIYFQHERSTAFALVILALYAGCYLGPVAAGFIVEGAGWRWCYYVQIIIYVIMFIFLLFTMENTSFRRDHTTEDEFEEGVIKAVQSKELHVATSIAEVNQETGEENDGNSIDESIPEKTYKQRMKLIQTDNNDERSWLLIFSRPFLMYSFPAIIWGGLVYGAQMMWLSLIGATQAVIYGAEPYNFSANGVGLTTLGAFGGSVIGMVVGGYLVDNSSIWLARRNHGILEPEFRLYAMIIPTISNAGGLLAYGLGAYYEAHWVISVVIGQGLLGVAMGSSGAICLTYAVDSYHNLASECIVFILFIRNMIGMIFCFVFEDWLDGCGLKLTTWLMFMLSILINGSFIVFIKWGKTFRKMTMASYHKYSDPTYGEIFKKKS
ncbi:uncharacterized protein J8A68_005280 [[Candida] subhashii]|uniref:Major facilitator superfamily (MFS) profile domain-containing protein n=1 Tax=[Candida] subhashii TaxID=561895 RepID=A0A8J5QI01_9ASCO|nr:uncharacterized protein J8A68_005280 [[Candida] subhashii]KAG7661208.1 hypothetical protein J8A68_005280 [[Candida] subhashii]